MILATEHKSRPYFIKQTVIAKHTVKVSNVRLKYKILKCEGMWYCLQIAADKNA